ncbi:uncharacterized protein LOC6031644 isoform X3 [Culex quinquefasciatus]|uniref:uncharacterized protein LOC6031644 isoform X3 n=1 Tax=Culex quinquefasciatus TaxID=7176 RepID=UPI0018E3A238|nr:uncharacterized protein LOC6031644 isoform X3 [Culex quinquefasciatus]
MIKCLILGCVSAKDPTDGSGGVLFFEFPNDTDVRRKWCDSIEAFQGPLTEFTEVCERHFEPEALVENRYLKWDAVPTLFETNDFNGTKTLLEVINGCVEQDGSGQVSCRLQENDVPCCFSQERFESRALLRHICEAHVAFAEFVGLSGVKRTNRMISTCTNGRSKVAQLTKKVLNHVSIDEDGYRCRIEGSTCLYFQLKMFPNNFARHFRDMHPVKAFDNGYFDGFRREDICLKKKVKFINRNARIKNTVRSKVTFDGTRYHCSIGHSQCDYSVKIFNVEKLRRHFCEEHPTEAGQYRLFKTTQRLIRADSDQESLPLNNSDCRYKQRGFVPGSFYCHFSLHHPVEARAKGFFASEEHSEREPTPVPMETAEEFITSPSDDDLRLTTPSDDPSSYCRLCFSIAQPLRPIFAGPEDIDGGGLVELISNCTNIRLCARTDFPSSICYECTQKLDDIQRFRQLCETLDTVVRRQGRMKRDLSVESDGEPEVTPVADAPQVETIANSTDDGRQSVPEKRRNYTELSIRDQIYFKCTDCGFLSTSGENVKRHWVRFHTGRKKLAAKITCSVTGCSDFFFSPKTQKHHLEIVHGIRNKVNVKVPDRIKIDEAYVKLEESQYACRNCGKLYPTIPSVLEHFKQSHRWSKIYRKEKIEIAQESPVDNVCQAVVINGVSYFKCRDCEVLMVKKSDLAVHWLQQHGEGANGSH